MFVWNISHIPYVIFGHVSESWNHLTSDKAGRQKFIRPRPRLAGRGATAKLRNLTLPYALITGCVAAPDLCQRRLALAMRLGNFLSPTHAHNPHPLTDHQINCCNDYVGDPYGCAKLGANPSTNAFWANGCNISTFLFAYWFIHFFCNSPKNQTGQRIFTLDGSNDEDSRKDVPFGGFIDIAPHFRGENPNFGVRE